MNRHRALLVVAGLLLSAFTRAAGVDKLPTRQLDAPTTYVPGNISDPSGTLETFSQTRLISRVPFSPRSEPTAGPAAVPCGRRRVEYFSGRPATAISIHAGNGSVFRALDGANCPSATSLPRSRNHGIQPAAEFRAHPDVVAGAANAEFSIISIDDPYQCPKLRRPSQRSTASASFHNLKFINGIMWDGREPDLKTRPWMQPWSTPSPRLRHGCAADPDRSLESSVFTAQSVDTQAGDLTAQGATGGPVALSAQAFSPGINSGAALPLMFLPCTPLGLRHWRKRRGAAVHRARRVVVQYLPHGHFRRARIQRRSGRDVDRGHLLDLSRHPNVGATRCPR